MIKRIIKDIINHRLPPSPEEFVPTNTTSTAAYVAVETSVSILDTLIPNDKIKENMIIATETVTRLLTSEGRKVMITIGTIRHAPPAIAIMKRANASTNPETSLGSSPCSYSLNLFSRS